MRWLLLIVVGLLIFLILGASFKNAFKSLPKSVPVRIGKVESTGAQALRLKEIKLTEVQRLSMDQVGRSIASWIGQQKASAKYELTEYALSWKVSLNDGSFVPISAQVFVPVTNNQEFPLIVYGAGTTGLADRCAPSLEDLKRGNMGNYRNYVITEASQGYIVVLPNYEGFDNADRDPRYFNKESEARTLLSAAKALIVSGSEAKLPLQPGATFFGGYSQGGHAAFAAADYAARFTPDVPVAGVYGHGPTTNIYDLLISNPNLAAYFFASYSQVYSDINIQQILTTNWVKLLDTARKTCVDEGFSNGSANIQSVFTPEFGQALKNHDLSSAFPDIDRVFMENNAGTSYQNIPTLIVQGTTDPIVTNDEQSRFVNQLCERGIAVTLQKYPVHHFVTRDVSFNDTNAWIDAVSQKRSVENSCK